MDSLQDAAKAVLAGIVDPHTGRDLVAGGSLKGIGVDGDKLAVDLVLGYPAKSWHATLAAQARAALEADPRISAAVVSVSSRVAPHQVQKDLTPLPVEGDDEIARLRWHGSGETQVSSLFDAPGGARRVTLAEGMALARHGRRSLRRRAPPGRPHRPVAARSGGGAGRSAGRAGSPGRCGGTGGIPPGRPFLAPAPDHDDLSVHSPDRGVAAPRGRRIWKREGGPCSDWDGSRC